jgi:transcriptional regulator with GAF, ATPase, and Fis domain
LFSPAQPNIDPYKDGETYERIGAHMREIPSRRDFAALTEATAAIVNPSTLGFVQSLGQDRVYILYSTPHGIGEYVLPASDLPEVLHSSNGFAQAGAATLHANPSGVFEWHLLAGDVQRVASMPLGSPDRGIRFWIGLSDPDELTEDQRITLAAIAESHAGVLTTALTAEEIFERHRRLELAAELLRELLRVLDVREVFNRLSAIAQKALPHDVLLLRFLNEDLTKVLHFAKTGGGADLDMAVSHAYPAYIVRAWNFDISDDLPSNPRERDKPPAKIGMRSSLRLPIRFDDRVIGGLGFLSFQPGKYTSADVVIGRRLADHVAVALSHHNLAQQLAAQARNTEALRTRTTNLELLDELLESLSDSGSMPDVFKRISALAGKVLAHDALLLMVRLPDGRHARTFWSTGLPEGFPEVTEVPQELLENPNWEHDIFDDLSMLEQARYVRLEKMGFQSLLRVPILLDGQFGGALVFLSKTKASFIPADVLIAHRISDRVTVVVARDREVAASRRADEAAERAARLEARVRELTDELDSRTGYRRVVGESPEWRLVLKQATQVAATEATVLLLGDSGTGKEVVARFVHRASGRNSGPFVALNCAALPEHLLEAELFGYEKGAYTGAIQSKPGQLEQAAGGTLFLDEVGEMSPSAQAKFLRVLQEREFQRLGGTRVLRTDARVVAATNRDLQRAITQGQFREDLYYRLNVFAIRLPALRHRRDDILPLSEAFIGEIGRSIGRPPAGISRDARQMLLDYHWPGNVRELRNILERAAILCDGGLITADHLALTVIAPAPSPLPAPSTPPPSVQNPVSSPDRAFSAASAASGASGQQPASASDLQSMERTMIEQALEKARFNKSKAAKALGLTRHQLYVRMRKYGFE